MYVRGMETDMKKNFTCEILKNNYGMIVRYWTSPSRQSRNRCIQSKISRYNLDRGRAEFSAIATPTGSRWASNNYITQCHRQFELVGVWVTVQDSENQLPAEGLSPQDPWLSSLAEWERSAALVRGTWSQYVAVCSVSNSPLTHNPFATLSKKVWEVYFSKEVGSFVIIVDYVSVYICIHIVVSRLYNITTLYYNKNLKKRFEGC